MDISDDEPGGFSDNPAGGIPGEKHVDLIGDIRERASEKNFRGLLAEVQEHIQQFKKYNSAIGFDRQQVPISDFCFRAGDGIAPVLVERKAIRDIVGRSSSDDQTRQLERMANVNPSGTNILLLDGELGVTDIAEPFGAGDRPSCWDPQIRYGSVIRGDDAPAAGTATELV